MISKEVKQEIEKALNNLLKENNVTTVQIFNCYDTADDYKEVLYKNDDVEVLYAPDRNCVEIIGLNRDDYKYFFDKYGYSSLFDYIIKVILEDGLCVKMM